MLACLLLSLPNSFGSHLGSSPSSCRSLCLCMPSCLSCSPSAVPHTLPHSPHVAAGRPLGLESSEQSLELSAALFFVSDLSPLKLTVLNQNPGTQDTCQCLEMFLIVLTEGVLLVSKARAENSAKHPTMHRTEPPTQHDLPQNVKATRLRKPELSG